MHHQGPTEMSGQSQTQQASATSTAIEYEELKSTVQALKQRVEAYDIPRSEIGHRVIAESSILTELQEKKSTQTREESTATQKELSSGKEILFVYPSDASLESLKRAYNSALIAILTPLDHLTILWANPTAGSSLKESKSQTFTVGEGEWPTPSTFKITGENFEKSTQAIRERFPFLIDFVEKTSIQDKPFNVKIHTQASLHWCLQQEFENVNGRESSYDMVVYPCGEREDVWMEKWILEHSPIPTVLLRNY